MIPGAAKGLVTSLPKGRVQKSWYIIGAVVCISKPSELTRITNSFLLQDNLLHITHLFIPTSQRSNRNGYALHSTPLWSHCGSLALANPGSSDRWRENLRMALLAVR
jgi:hypothetical protein